MHTLCSGRGKEKSNRVKFDTVEKDLPLGRSKRQAAAELIERCLLHTAELGEEGQTWRK